MNILYWAFTGKVVMRYDMITDVPVPIGNRRKSHLLED